MGFRELLLRADDVVNELVQAVENRGYGVKEVEEVLLQYTNSLASLMEQEVVDLVSEPHQENRVYVEGEEAVFDQKRNLRFRNRFGGETVRARRCYKFLNKEGGYSPLDEMLATDKCGGFSPLMTFLIALLAAGRPFEESARILSKTLGFSVSSTAVQRNSEEAGAQLSDEPLKVINQRKRRQGCDVMLVEMDSTTSPQIHQEDGITGRESLKQPTEWKMCHVGTIQKLRGGQVKDEWTVARYGKLEDFGFHLGRSALALGQEKAQKVVFLADGLHANWQICYDHFPGALQILDFYHAAEHLSDFCALLPDQEKAGKSAEKWRGDLLEGQVLQVMAEMRAVIPTLTDTDRAWKEYRYFKNNWQKMSYDKYVDAGLPIGSGKVEGGCKFVVGKRFKGNGMRWKKADNQKILRARLASLNGYLERHYRPSPRAYTFTPPADRIAS